MFKEKFRIAVFISESYKDKFLKMDYIPPLLYYRSNRSKPVHYYCILYLNVFATIDVLCWRSSDATGLKCDGASLNHFACVFLLLYLAFRTRTTWRLHVMRYHSHNESQLTGFCKSFPEDLYLLLPRVLSWSSVKLIIYCLFSNLKSILYNIFISITCEYILLHSKTKNNRSALLSLVLFWFPEFATSL